MTGNVEFTIGEKKRGFRLGTYTLMLISEKTGITSIPEVFKIVAENKDIKVLLAFYHCCAIHFCESKRIEIDFLEVDVSEWIDELGWEKLNALTSQLINDYLPKNLNPPQATGETTQ